MIDLGRMLPAGRPYELRKTGGPPVADLDAWFYPDLGNRGAEACRDRVDDDGTGGERGSIPCAARWAVVVLFTGADVGFSLSW